MVQDLQVVLGPAPFVPPLAEPVIGQAESRRRKQIVAVRVVRERARLADQRVDEVAIVHGVLVATHQPRQRVDVRVRIPDLNPVGEQPRLDPLADEPTVHRIGVALDVDQTAGVDATGHLQTR